MTEWGDVAYMAVVEVAGKKATFTGDDVMDLLEESNCLAKESRALGPVMMKAQKRGVMEKTEQYVSSRRKTQHGSPRRVWKSLIVGVAE